MIIRTIGDWLPLLIKHNVHELATYLLNPTIKNMADLKPIITAPWKSTVKIPITNKMGILGISGCGIVTADDVTGTNNKCHVSRKKKDYVPMWNETRPIWIRLICKNKSQLWIIFVMLPIEHK